MALEARTRSTICRFCHCSMLVNGKMKSVQVRKVVTKQIQIESGSDSKWFVKLRPQYSQLYRWSCFPSWASCSQPTSKATFVFNLGWNPYHIHQFLVRSPFLLQSWATNPSGFGLISISNLGAPTASPAAQRPLAPHKWRRNMRPSFEPVAAQKAPQKAAVFQKKKHQSSMFEMAVTYLAHWFSPQVFLIEPLDGRYNICSPQNYCRLLTQLILPCWVPNSIYIYMHHINIYGYVDT